MDVCQNLQGATHELLRNPSGIKKWLTLADKYMQTFEKDPNIFLLPKAHEFLKPIIEAYARNPEGFLQYLLGLRDSFSKQDLAWLHVQTIYRRLNGRYVQQQRRERSNRAVDKAKELYGEVTFTARLGWVAELEHDWAKRRLDFLDGYRAKSTTDRIDHDTRAELLAEFWDIIDTEIHKGALPPWN